MNAPAPAIDVDSPAEGTAPSTARITHWLLGGERHHQPADRRLGIRVLNAAPWTEAALEKPYLNRSWNVRFEQGSWSGDLPVVRA
ncbi:hypothetical protein OG887_39940 [Streptomyces sp. NBC_00053]|uniref:hypothetical protein n=1 Tax=unclassified Streptomyces TaxID=2593676 RepID=UPI000FB97483|nr:MULTISPECIES: hypothetical protein [unclassified Streptomyces]WSG48483.1 hypothetical protein OHA38_00730 [Streptomyces sp. NBC_01732]WSW99133.1 hypothetical protein OG355_00840 [Streptomyces sp. NBC_00987]MCX4399430.1 hypothetical protein [Streptomyces sp. NBC_01767]MCX5103133.1 hypothetical protein [Streptomyces sp. NBC_00439]MCX5165957.1 hypothetical protein [Streptomyces sp. NBC_00305]